MGQASVVERQSTKSEPHCEGVPPAGPAHIPRGLWCRRVTNEVTWCRRFR